MRPGQNGAVGMVLPVMTFAFRLFFVCFCILFVGLAYLLMMWLRFFLACILFLFLLVNLWLWRGARLGCFHCDCSPHSTVYCNKYTVVGVVGNGTATTEIELIRELRILETSWFVRWVGKLALIPIRSLFCGLWL